MNVLPIEKRVQIINLLVEGSSLRAASRISGCSINTVTKLLVDVGQACQAFHDEAVYGLTSTKIQCDEIWSFVYAKDKNAPEEMKQDGTAGDIWTWTALDADSKFIVSWFVGNRDGESAYCFMKDVARRIANRVQVTTDGYHAYITSVSAAFGSRVDFAMLHKIYGGETGKGGHERKYSPAECTGINKKVVKGKPAYEHISTSFVERQNLTMRMHMRRFTRLTNAFSKKLENHCHAIALHFMYYNFVRIHKTIRVTPAMEAGLVKRPWTITDIVNLTNANFNAEDLTLNVPTPKTEDEIRDIFFSGEDWS